MQASLPVALDGGVDERAWRRRLSGPDLVLRLHALRVFARRGPAGACALLSDFTPRSGEIYPWVWALTQCAPLEMLGVPRYPASPLHLVRFLLRRRRNPSLRVVGRSREECMEALAAAVHPLHVLTCVVRLLDLHGDSSVPPMLDFLQHRPGRLNAHLWEEKAECLSWALGQQGRSALGEVMEVYRRSSRRARPHLAMSMWYLGERALRAVPLLLDDPEPSATAALLSMQGAAALVMVRARRWPVWPDPAAISELASLAFSVDPQDRIFAVRALASFGSSASIPIFQQLASDASPEVRCQVSCGLEEARREQLPLLLKLCHDPDPSVALAASRGARGADRSDLHFWARHGDLGTRRGAAARLAESGLLSLSEPEIAGLLLDSDGETLMQLLEALARHGRAADRATLLEIVSRPKKGPEARGAALRALGGALAEDEILLGLLDDEDLGVEAARRLVSLLPDRPGVAQALAIRLPTLPGPVLHILVGGPHWEARPLPEFIPVLQKLLLHPDQTCRRDAAHALRAFAQVDSTVVRCLESALQDPCIDVAVEAATALVRLGHGESHWQLLASPDYRTRIKTYEWLRSLEGLPPSLLEAVRQGQLDTELTFTLLEGKLADRELAQLLLEAIPRLPPGRSPAPQALLGLGREGLRVLETLLDHEQLRVRHDAVDLLEEALLKDSPGLVDWLLLARLPQESDSGLQERIHRALADFLQRATRTSGEPRLLPLVLDLCRSPHPAAAATATAAAAQIWLFSHRAEALDVILDVLGGLEAYGRRFVLEQITLGLLLRAAQAPPEQRHKVTRHLSEMDADPDPQVEYRRLGLLGGLGAMGPRQFRQVVSFLAHHPRYATTEVLVAPGCFPHLVDLLSDEDLAISAEAARLLVERPFQPDQAGREALQAALSNPRVAVHVEVLRKRWPELLPPP